MLYHSKKSKNAYLDAISDNICTGKSIYLYDGKPIEEDQLKSYTSTLKDIDGEIYGDEVKEYKPENLLVDKWKYSSYNYSNIHQFTGSKLPFDNYSIRYRLYSGNFESDPINECKLMSKLDSTNNGDHVIHYSFAVYPAHDFEVDILEKFTTVINGNIINYDPNGTNKFSLITGKEYIVNLYRNVIGSYSTAPSDINQINDIIIIDWQQHGTTIDQSDMTYVRTYSYYYSRGFGTVIDENIEKGDTRYIDGENFIHDESYGEYVNSVELPAGKYLISVDREFYNSFVSMYDLTCLTSTGLKYFKSYNTEDGVNDYAIEHSGGELKLMIHSYSDCGIRSVKIYNTDVTTIKTLPENVNLLTKIPLSCKETNYQDGNIDIKPTDYFEKGMVIKSGYPTHFLISDTIDPDMNDRTISGDIIMGTVGIEGSGADMIINDDNVMIDNDIKVLDINIGIE